MGTINPLGHNVEDTWTALLEGKSAISKIELFDASTFPWTFAATEVDPHSVAVQFLPIFQAGLNPCLVRRGEGKLAVASGVAMLFGAG